MGYYIFIQREEMADGSREKIALEEWLEVVASGIGFELWEGDTDVWTLKGSEIRPAFFYSEDNGYIMVRYGYFKDVITKVLEAAHMLSAIVIGESGETYPIKE